MSSIKRKIFPVLKDLQVRLKSIGASLVNFLTWGKKKNRSHKVDLDRKLVYSLSSSKIPTLRQLKYLKRFLSKRELWIIRILVVVIIINLGILSFNFYQNNFQVVPVHGGEYTEGLVGSPQYINPLYASVSDIDRDISNLVFSGLFDFSDKKGLKKDLVKSYSVSEDEKEYIFQLREDVKWHNGNKLTAEDVVFTFKAIKNPDYNSPLKSRFSGVSIEQQDRYKVKFSLQQKKPRFLSLLTFGILPSQLWSQISPESTKLAELNLKPIGSGPYEFESLIKDKKGNILTYELKANPRYYSQVPYIQDLNFEFFVSAREAISALNRNEIDGLGYLPPDGEEDLVAKKSLNIHRLSLPQVDSLFFNGDINKNLKSKKIRKALAFSLDKDKIVSEVLQEDAQTVVSPLPPYSDSYNSQVPDYKVNIKKAKSLLEEEEWVKKEFTSEEIEEIKAKKKKIEEMEEKEKSEEEAEEESSSDTEDDSEEKPELTDQERVKLKLGTGEWRVKATSSRETEELSLSDCLLIELTVPQDRKTPQIAKRIKSSWEELGIRTIIREVSLQDIYSRVIKPRDFETLLYTQAFSSRPDLYSFWHSSQIEGGLNVAGYESEEVDRLLEEARQADWDSETRKKKYRQIQEKLAQDLPALFLYSPYYTYVQSKNINNFDLQYITSPKDRFSGVENWYTQTGKKLIW